MIQLHVLRLKLPLGVNVLLSMVTIAIIIGLSELILRAPAVQPYLPPADIGAPNPEIQAKWDLLNARINEDPIDCIFVGSSVVSVAVNPELFNAGRCFNFGISAASLEDAADLGVIIARQTGIRKVIFGYTYPAYATHHSMTEFPWARYMLGEFSLQGWLYQHSLSFAEYHTAMSWYRNGRAATAQWYRWVSSYGYLRLSYEEKHLTAASLPDELIRQSERTDVEMVGAEGLRLPVEHIMTRLTELKALDVQVVLVQMPAPQEIGMLYEHSPYTDFEALIEQRAVEIGVPIIRSDPALLPLDHFADIVHLNDHGAAVFTEWMSDQLAPYLSSVPEG
jgi:hypothetical protein